MEISSGKVWKRQWEAAVPSGCGKVWKWLCKVALIKSGRGHGNVLPQYGRPWKAAGTETLTLLAPSNIFFGNTIVESRSMTSYHYLLMINCVERYFSRKYVRNMI
jgi:hypothetical protein